MSLSDYLISQSVTPTIWSNETASGNGAWRTVITRPTNGASARSA